MGRFIWKALYNILWLVFPKMGLGTQSSGTIHCCLLLVASSLDITWLQDVFCHTFGPIHRLEGVVWWSEDIIHSWKALHWSRTQITAVHCQSPLRRSWQLKFFAWCLILFCLYFWVLLSLFTYEALRRDLKAEFERQITSIPSWSSLPILKLPNFLNSVAKWIKRGSL